MRKGNRKVKLELSGYVNEALLFWDDGLESNVYQGTNDVQRSRFRFKGESKINDEWKAGFLIELGVRANRLSRTDERTDEGGSEIDLRYSAMVHRQQAIGPRLAWQHVVRHGRHHRTQYRQLDPLRPSSRRRSGT